MPCLLALWCYLVKPCHMALTQSGAAMPADALQLVPGQYLQDAVQRVPVGAGQPVRSARSMHAAPGAAPRAGTAPAAAPALRKPGRLRVKQGRAAAPPRSHTIVFKCTMFNSTQNEGHTVQLPTWCRRNSITGVLYRDDPVIAAWNILNEVGCSLCCLQLWVLLPLT